MRPFVKTALLTALGAGLVLSAAHSLAQGVSAAPPAPAAVIATPSAAPALSPAPAPPAAVAAPRRASLKPAPATVATPALPLVASAPPRPGARLAPGTPIPPIELEAFVDGVVREGMARDHIAGATVSVVQNGQIALKKGYGFARLDPARPVDADRTLFRLGPVSQTLTWIVVMKEVEAGHIRLATPINLYLPEKLQVRDQGYKRPVFVGDLMTHSAGFEDRALGHLFEDNPDRVRPLAVYLRQERPRRVREAGTLSSPSDYGVALAGEAASYVTNKPFEALVESEITGPLGLAHTTFREPYPKRDDLPAPMPASLAADLSDGYRWTDGGFQPRLFEYASQIAPAQAAASTAADMARYMLMILGGGQSNGASVYNAGTASAFRTPANGPSVGGWAAGFKAMALPDGFDGQGQTGGTLSFSSSLVVIPQLDLGVFIATNTESGRRLALDLPARIVSRFYASPGETPLSGSADLVDRAPVYAGTYLTTRRSYDGLEKFVDLLRGWIKVVVTPDGRLVVSGPSVGPMAYAPRGGADQFRQVQGQERLTFQIEDGRARRILGMADNGAFDRAGPLNQLPLLVLLAGLTVIASLATLIGALTRDRRESRQTSTQRRANLLQTTIAVLWILSVMMFGAWARAINDQAKLIYDWPGATLMIASACALVAGLLTVVCLVIGPSVWRGGRRVDSWTAGRKLGFTLSTFIFAAFSVVLFAWGALQPWSG